MDKNKRILFNFSLYVLLGLFIMFWGITHPAAASYNYNEFMAQLYDNYGPTLSAVSTNQTNNRWEGTIPDMTAYSSGAAWGISSPVVLIAGHTYSLTAKITGYYGGNIVKSTYDRIGVGDTLENARYSYQNNSNVNELYSSAPQTYGLIQFAFTTNVNGNYIVFPFATSYTGSNQTFWLETIIVDDLGASGVSQSQITNSLNNQTNTINNSITNSENNIKSNSDINKQEIIDNQNENNDKLIESNQELLGNCNTNIMTSSDIITLYNLWQAGNDFQQQQADTATSLTLLTQAFNNGSYMYPVGGSVNITSTGRYKIGFTKKSDYNQILFKLNGIERDTGVLIDVSNLEDDTVYYISADFFNLTQGNIQFRNVMISKTDTNTFVAWGKTVCNSKLDEANETSKGILGKLGDLFSNLFSNEDADISGLDNMVGWLPPGPVDSIINLPLSFFNALTNTLSGTCQDVSLTLPFVNQVLTLPCFDSYMTQYLEHFSTFWTLVGSIVSIFILYNYLLALYKWVDDTLTFRENNLPGYYGDNWGGGA